MLNILEIFRLKNYKGEYGIEIEMETSVPVDDLWVKSDIADWNKIKDGSLRNHGSEFISKVPVTYSNVDHHLDSVFKFFDLIKPLIVKDSTYTSVHVHRNVSKLTPTKAYNVTIAYWCIENLLFKMYGPLREGSCFCLRLVDTPGILTSLDYDAAYGQFFNSYEENIFKYGGINLSSVATKGSLEFRGMSGEYDKKKIKRNIDIIEGLYNWAIRFSKPTDVLDYVYANGIKGMLSDVYKNDKDTLEYLLDLNSKFPNVNQETIELMASRIYEIFWVDDSDTKPAAKKAPNVANDGPLLLVVDDAFVVGGENQWLR